MRILAFLICLLAGAAQAQNVTCPTRPLGDTSNACASDQFVQQQLSSGTTNPAITGLTGDVAATGPGSVAATIQPGVVTSAKMAAGAAATNVGTLGGVLTGALPNPGLGSAVVAGSNIVAGTVANSNLANMAARTLKGNFTGSSAAPQDIPNGQVAYVSVYGYGASGSTQSTTGTIGVSSSSLTLAVALDFINGQGIRVTHAGAAPTNVGTPTSPSVSNVGAAGATTYTYQIASIDFTGGVGVATSTFQTTTGNATLNTTNYNSLTWTAPSPAPAGYAIWRGSTFIGLTANSGASAFVDQGQSAPVTPDWIPATAPASALADSLLTTISSGGGTTTLALAAAATTAASGTFVGHDDSAAIQACLNASAASAAVRCFAPGVFQSGTLINWPNTGSVGLVGAGRGFNAVGPPNNVGLPGTKIIATQAQFCVICAANGPSFTNGNYLADITIDGNTLATIPLDIAWWGSSTIRDIDVNNAISGGVNYQHGHSGADPLESTITSIRADNPLMAHNVPNLPFASIEIAAANNHFTDIFGINAKTAGIHTVSGLSANNTFNGAHCYNFDYSINTATAATNCMLIEGSGDQFINWETDGATSANIQVNGNGNIFTNGYSLFQTPLTAQIGIQFANGTNNNRVIASDFVNSTVANSVVQAGTPGTGGNYWDYNVNTTNSTSLGNPWTAFTPSPSCGTATFTVNSARAKTRGKDTFAEIDITFSALGTCTNNLSFTLPNTANSSGSLNGRDQASTANQVSCIFLASASTAFCTGVNNFTGTTRIVASGVYENQ